MPATVDVLRLFSDAPITLEALFLSPKLVERKAVLSDERSHGLKGENTTRTMLQEWPISDDAEGQGIPSFRNHFSQKKGIP